MDEAEVEVDAAKDDERGSGGAKILKDLSLLISSFTHVLNFLIIAENLSVRIRKSQLKRIF